jgi:NAD(P)-dependent dehydrogenase (short-subunit alcohol dehydrogenase family)
VTDTIAFVGRFRQSTQHADVHQYCNPVVSVVFQVLDVNLFGTIDVTMTFLPLIKRSRGRIVNMSSAAGRFAVPVATPYTISKYGVEAFTDNLRYRSPTSIFQAEHWSR